MNDVSFIFYQQYKEKTKTKRKQKKKKQNPIPICIALMFIKKINHKQLQIFNLLYYIKKGVKIVNLFLKSSFPLLHNLLILMIF